MKSVGPRLYAEAMAIAKRLDSLIEKILNEEDWGDLGIEQDHGTIAEENSW